MWMASKGHFFGQIPVAVQCPIHSCVDFLALEHTTSDTQALRDESDLGGRLDFDTQFTGLDDRATALALWLWWLVCGLVVAVSGLYYLDDISLACTCRC